MFAVFNLKPPVSFGSFLGLQDGKADGLRQSIASGGRLTSTTGRIAASPQLIDSVENGIA
jgi:hypothetical protein